MNLLRPRIWLAERLRPSEWQVMLAWAAVAGVAGALGSILFRAATEDVHRALTGSREGVVESFRIIPPWLRIAVPAAGGLIAGLALRVGRYWSGDRPATDYMEAMVIGDGRVPVRASLGRIVASLFVIGSGGSVGREGPMVQLSAVLGSGLGRCVRLTAPRLRLLVACGAAAGIASAYNAPIAGAFFVAEIVLGTIAMESLGPLVTASVAATVTMHSFGAIRPIYEVPHFGVTSVWEFAPYVVLGALAGLIAPVFLVSLRRAERAFVRTGLPMPLRLALGGLIVGLLAVRVPEVCGNGYSVVLDILNGRVLGTTLLVIVVCKWLATAGSVGSGAPGGVFTPTLFMGASAGLLFGTGLRWLWPHGPVQPQAYALVGMGAFLSAATQAPVMALIMLFEMTLSYDIILPLSAAAVVAYFIARGLEGGESLYGEAIRRRQQASGFRAIGLDVGELMRPNPPVVIAGAPFERVAQEFLRVRVNHLYVIDEAGAFRGVVSLHDIKPYLQAPELASLLVAADVMRDFPQVAPRQRLAEALDRFQGISAERLPVVAPDGRLAGSLAKTDVLLALAERLNPSPAAA